MGREILENDLKKLLLLSPLDSLVPSAGFVTEESSFAIPEGLWNCMGEGRYFLKAFDLDSLEERGAWRWSKEVS